MIRSSYYLKIKTPDGFDSGQTIRAIHHSQYYCYHKIIFYKILLFFIFIFNDFIYLSNVCVFFFVSCDYRSCHSKYFHTECSHCLFLAYCKIDWLMNTGFTAPQHNIGFMAPIQDKSCRIHISQRQKNTGREKTEDIFNEKWVQKFNTCWIIRYR